MDALGDYHIERTFCENLGHLSPFPAANRDFQNVPYAPRRLGRRRRN